MATSDVLDAAGPGSLDAAPPAAEDNAVYGKAALLAGAFDERIAVTVGANPAAK